MITLYGIPNCNTVKKARDWLELHGIEFTFHKFRVDGLDRETIESWLGTVDWTILLNKRSTSWRSLEDATKDNIDQDSAINEMLKSPTLIKRPVLVINEQILVGFNVAEYEKLV